jgi:hypothetical protein
MSSSASRGRSATRGGGSGSRSPASSPPPRKGKSPMAQFMEMLAKASVKDEDSKTIKIPPFSALVFRQDLVHAGTKYKVANLRLHFYMNLIADDYKSQKDRTFYVDEKFWLISKPKRNK